MRLALIVAVLAAACSHTRDSELTAEGHRAAAWEHERKGHQELNKFDPGRTVVFPTRGPATTDPNLGVSAYNPTENHLRNADGEMNAAAQHLNAARKLQHSENLACYDVPEAERSACPLLASSVSQVVNTRTGIELQLKASEDATAVFGRLRCHLAYAEANGFADPSCPLFVRDMTIGLHQPNVVVMSGKRPAVARALQDQARRVFAPDTLPPPAVSRTQ